MSIRSLTEVYLARARDLENQAQRLEQHPQRWERIPPSICLSPLWRDATFLRREARWWRGCAQDLARAT